MDVIFCDRHALHDPAHFHARGRASPYIEIAPRVDALLSTARRRGLRVSPPQDHGMAPIRAVHDPGYLAFLETAWARWQALPDPSPAIVAHAFPVRHMEGRPEHVVGQAGYYLSGGSAPMVAGTWDAACRSAQTALTAAALLAGGAREAYALCRPPGHHAYGDLGGGFCYLNNVAIAAEALRAKLARVAILDIDVHHGNGTQGIFYARDDVHFVSVHGDPAQLFPYFAGYAEERGAGAGTGHTLNLPLPMKSEDGPWLAAVEQGLASIRRFAPGALCVSLGFDAFKGDPSADLAVSTRGFGRAGSLIGALGVPILLVQEGGYVVPSLAANLDAFLDGFLAARPATV